MAVTVTGASGGARSIYPDLPRTGQFSGAPAGQHALSRSALLSALAKGDREIGRAALVDPDDRREILSLARHLSDLGLMLGHESALELLEAFPPEVRPVVLDQLVGDDVFAGKRLPTLGSEWGIDPDWAWKAGLKGLIPSMSAEQLLTCEAAIATEPVEFSGTDRAS